MYPPHRRRAPAAGDVAGVADTPSLQNGRGRGVLLRWVIVGSLATSLPAEGAIPSSEVSAAELGGEWATQLRDADNRYLDLIRRWREALSASDNDDAFGAARRLRLDDQIRALEEQRDTLVEDQTSLKAERAARTDATTVRDTILKGYEGGIINASGAVRQAVDDLRAALESTRRSGRMARALEAWWNAYRFLDWPAVLDGGPDPREPLRQELEVRAAALGATPTEAVASLLRLARDEERVRSEQRAYVLRAPEAGPTTLDADIAKGEADLADVLSRLQRFQGYREEVGRKVPSAAEALLLDDTEALRARYGTLERALERDPSLQDIPIARAQWCALYAHAGMLGYLLDDEDPGAMARLRTAISTYGGACTNTVKGDWDIMAVRAAWSEGLYLESREEAAWIVIDQDHAVWTVDGSPVSGPGATQVQVGAGTHRIEAHTGDDLSKKDAILEDFKPGEHIGLRVLDGRIQLDVLRSNDREWVVTVRREVPGGAVEGRIQDRRIEPERDWAAGGGGTLLRFDAHTHVGSTFSVGRRVGGVGPASLGAGVAFDALGGSSVHRYGDISTAALLRVRTEIWARGPQGTALRPVVSVSPGIVPPLQGATLDIGGGVDAPLPQGFTITGQVGFTSSFWRQGSTWMEPVAHLGVLRWF